MHFKSLTNRSYRFFATLLCLIGFSLNAAELFKTKFEDSIKLDGKDFVLNGLGVRKASMFKVKVYVAGLYLTKKTSDEKEILDSSSPKKLEMEFVHLVEKEKIQDNWLEGFDKNCEDKASCEKNKEAFKNFRNAMEDMREHQRMSVTFFSDKVLLEVKGKQKGSFESEGIGKNLLRIFLGPNPPNPDLKKGLLGLPID